MKLPQYPVDENTQKHKITNVNIFPQRSIGTLDFPWPMLSTDTLELFIVEGNTLELQCSQTEPLNNIVCFQSALT